MSYQSDQTENQYLIRAILQGEKVISNLSFTGFSEQDALSKAQRQLNIAVVHGIQLED